MSIQQILHPIVNLFNPTPANAYVIGQEVTLHAHYQDYRGWLIAVNEITNRAELLIDNHVLGEYRILFVNLDRVEA